MAKKSFTSDVGEVNLTHLVEKIESEKTKQAIISVELNPSKDNIEENIDIISKDILLPIENRNQIIKLVKKKYLELFNFNNCPDDYDLLKKEVVFLHGITQYSFILMAQRLKKIRDKRLYEKDNYNSFKEFIENELNVSRQTAYKYIDIIDYFGVATLRHLETERFDYSKLIPVLPILKANDSLIPKDKIKKDFLSKAKYSTFRDITADAFELKKKYNLVKGVKSVKSLKDGFLKYIKTYPDNLTDTEIVALNDISQLIETILSNKDNWKEKIMQ